MANQYLPFAVGTSPNTMTYSAYAALPAVGTGFVSGVASSEQFNTLMRQVSVPASGLAQWASETSGINAVDDGSVTNFKSLINSAVSARLAAYLPLTGGAITGSLTLPGASGLNGFMGGTGDGASYTTFNFVMRGWWGLGMTDYTNAVRGYYDFRTGKWDTLGGYYVNGVRTWDATNFDPGNYLPLAGGTVTGALTVNGSVNVSTAAAADASSSVANTRHVTNKINTLFTCSNGNTGWAKYSTGQIEQWGQVYVGDLGSSGTSSYFTFPIAFPNACNSVQLTCYDANNIGRAIPAVTSVPSATGFTFRLDEASTLVQNITVYITARGY